MKRRELSSEEMEKVIKRKRSGDSWLKIEKETGMPRRAAKRAYENWERSRSIEELGQVRRDIALDEFRQHLGHLSQLAESLVRHLRLPEEPSTTESGKQFLSSLWHNNIIGETDAEQTHFAGTHVAGNERETRRIKHQNKLLYKSLRDHTHEDVRWVVLKEWEWAWDNSLDIRDEIRKEARKVIENIVDLERGLRERIQKQCEERDAVDMLVDAVIWVIWWAIREDKLDQEDPFVITRSDDDGTSYVRYFEDSHARRLFECTGMDLAKEVAKTCNWVVNNLCKGDKSYMIRSLQNNFSSMEASIEKLEEMLNPLLLRPIIIRTRCDLCPA